MATETFAQLAARLSRTSKPSETDFRKFWGDFYHVSALDDSVTVEKDVVKVIIRHTLPQLLINKAASTPVFTEVWNRALGDASGLSIAAQEELVAAWADLLVVETAGLSEAERKTWFLTSPRYQTYSVIVASLPKLSYPTVGSLWRVMNTLFNGRTAEKILAAKVNSADASAVMVASYYVHTVGGVSASIKDRLAELMAGDYPELADLPPAMLLDVVASQPFPSDWFVDVSLMPDELAWVAPGQAVEHRA